MRGREKSARPLLTTAALFIAVMGLTPQVSFADEDGVSFWIPGTFGSLAAVPGEPGWSFATFNYYDNISAGADVAAAREITVRDLNPTLRLNLSASLHACAYLAAGRHTIAVIARPRREDRRRASCLRCKPCVGHETEKARELGCDENSAAADELIGRLAKMAPSPRKP
jgi:hypothetical protein